MFKVADSISEDAFYIAANNWTREEGESWQAGKRYGAFRSAVEFVTNMLEISSNRCFYEIIIENCPCKPIWTSKPKREPCQMKRVKL